MKKLLILPLFSLLTACTFDNTHQIEYQQVIAGPSYPTLTIVDDEPVDVTTDSVELY